MGKRRIKEEFNCYAVLHHVIEDDTEFYYIVIPELNDAIIDAYSWSDAIKKTHCYAEFFVKEFSLNERKYKTSLSISQVKSKDKDLFNDYLDDANLKEISLPQIVRITVDVGE